MATFKRFMSSKPIIGIVTVLASICLSVVLVAAGLFVCCQQPVTRALSNATSDYMLSPFDHDPLVEAAVATRDYTVDTHDITALTHAIRDLNLTLTTSGSGHIGAPSASAISSTDDPAVLQKIFDASNERYVLDSTAISHLDDVYNVISTAWRVIAVLAVLAVLSFAHLCYYRGKLGAGRALALCGGMILVLFGAAAVYAVVDFYSFFNFFHSFFFSDSSWLFSYDSLLICMLPEGFWMGMGVIWLSVTSILSILSLILGIVFIKQNRKGTRNV